MFRLKWFKIMLYLDTFYIFITSFRPKQANQQAVLKHLQSIGCTFLFSVLLNTENNPGNNLTCI